MRGQWIRIKADCRVSDFGDSMTDSAGDIVPKAGRKWPWAIEK